MTPYQFTQVSEQFIQELSDHVLRRESTVILGHRYAGKSYLLKELERNLRKTGSFEVMNVSLFKSEGIWTEQEASAVFRSAVPAEAVRGLESTDPPPEFFAPVDWLYQATKQPVVVLAGCVDAMGHDLARRFLQAMRARVEDERVIAALTGEFDLTQLVHGPGSEFNCAHHYFIQGYSWQMFDGALRGMARTRSIEFDSPEDATQTIWTLSGGDFGVADAILGALADQRVLSLNWESRPVRVDELQKAASNLALLGPASAVLLHRAAEIIAWEPSCWVTLRDLLTGKTVARNALDMVPGPLEVAGVARRTDASLEFASPFMRQFCEKFYTNRRLGDLYARHGDWRTAFDCWSPPSRSPKIRPSDLDDRAETAATVRALCASLHSRVCDGPEAVLGLFALGCRDVLGFETVTFWRRGQTWTPNLAIGSPAAREHTERLAALLPASGSLQRGLLPLPEPYCHVAVAAALDPLPPDGAAAVVLGDIESMQPISQERVRLASELLDHLVEAHSTAIQAKRNKQRLEIRDKHLDVIDATIDSLGSRLLDVRQALAFAARGLREVGYRRVLICLVDSTREKIKGIIDDSDDPSVNVAEMTAWRLDDPMGDIQPYVVLTRKTAVIPNPETDPLTNKEVVHRARLGAMAIVPMTDRLSQVVGTIHVERADHRAPSNEEVEDLELFGRQLATLISQSERVNFLQQTIEKSPDPILIVDSSARLRYANKKAEGLFAMTEGWAEPGELRPIDAYPTSALKDGVLSALGGTHWAGPVCGLGSDPEYRGVAVSDTIRDWRGQVIGALVHVENRDYLSRVFDALRMVAEADSTASAMQAFLKAAEGLGHPWGRLYLVDETDPDTLVSRLCYGIKDEVLSRRFNAGEFLLSRRASGESGTWRCIEEQKPLVLQWSGTQGEARVLTDLGLEVIPVTEALYAQEFGKQPGDSWMDFPLGQLGKVTLPVRPEMRPEQIRLLDLLSDNVARLLGAFRERDKLAKEREQMVLASAAERAVSITAHNIGTHLGALPVILGRYRLLEADSGRLHGINNDFSRVIVDCGNFIHGAKALLAEVVPEPTKFDIVEMLSEVLRTNLEEGRWHLKPEHPLEVEADRGLMETCLVHLIENSKKAVKNKSDVRVDVSVEVESGQQGDWIRIGIADHGPGISTEFKERIFDNYFSTRSPSQEKGLGLGLGFVRRVILAHGGKVTEEGRFGEGALFVIRMPRLASVEERRQ